MILAHTAIAEVFQEKLARRLSLHGPVTENVTEVLREGGFPGPEETGDPHSDAFIGFRRRTGHGAKEVFVLRLYSLCGDVFRKFGINRVLVGVVDLDDFFNGSGEIAFQYFGNFSHLFSSVNLHTVAAQRLIVGSKSHIVQAMTPRAGIRQNGGRVETPVKLLK